MSFVIRYSVSRTGADEGQRFAAFSIVSSGGMTNCSRTAPQKRSSGDGGVGGKSVGRGQALPGVRNGTAPPIASSRANSRRFMMPPMGRTCTADQRSIQPRHAFAAPKGDESRDRALAVVITRSRTTIAPYISIVNSSAATAVPHNGSSLRQNQLAYQYTNSEFRPMVDRRRSHTEGRPRRTWPIANSPATVTIRMPVRMENQVGEL